MGCCTTRGYRLYQKSFEQSSLVSTTTIHWQGILVSIKPENSLVGNTIGQALERRLSPTSKAATFVYHLKRLDISPIQIYRPYQYQPTNGKTS